MALTDRFRSAWNAFTTDNALTGVGPTEYGFATVFTGGSRPDRTRLMVSGERSIINSVYTRISMDIASVEMRHTRHDEDDRYLEDMDSGLNDCLTVEANIDQGAQAFRQDIVLTLFDKGVAAIVPVDTTIDPSISGSFDIRSLRVGEIVQWYPQHVKVSVYNERRGYRQEIVLPKRNVAIVENPLYQVMNEPSSTYKRLIRKLGMLDSVDEASSSGKLDLIIQLPYVVKSETRKQQAEQRAKDIEFQLRNNKYGVAYTDGTEKITQLNRPVENKLLDQITMLTNLLYTQLGITPTVMDGTADEKTMLNYMNRTVEPVLTAIVEAMRRAFLTKTARTQHQSIDYFRDPFKLVPLSDIAELADKLTRNEVLTSNELRGVIGFKPHSDPKADQLVNANMPIDKTGTDGTSSDGTTPPPDGSTPPATPPDPGVMSQSFDSINSAIDDAFSGLGLDEGGADAST